MGRGAIFASIAVGCLADQCVWRWRRGVTV